MPSAISNCRSLSWIVSLSSLVLRAFPICPCAATVSHRYRPTGGTVNALVPLRLAQRLLGIIFDAFYKDF
jgi:hypothetical protein